MSRAAFARCLALLALFAALVSGSATRAEAAEPSGPAVIDPDMRGSIVVAGPVPPGAISVYRVDDIDLTDPAAWQRLARLTAPEALARHELTQRAVTSTASTGDLVYGDLPVGVYIVLRAGVDPAIVTLPWAQDGVWTDRVRVIPKTPGPPTVAEHGYLRVVKVDEDHHARTLAGAQFEIRPVRDEGAARGAPIADPATGGTRFRTGDDGSFDVELETGDYELVEVVAPSGYRLVSDPIRVTIVAGGLEDRLVQIVGNPRATLAVTGADIWASIVAGSCLLGVGGLLLALRARRDRGTRRSDDRP